MATQFKIGVPSLIFVLLVKLFCQPIDAAPQDFPLARPPQEAIEPTAIDRFERLFTDGTYSADETIRFVGDEIGRYTGQFREKRRNDRRALPLPEELADLDSNMVRLLSIAQDRETGSGFFYLRSPYLQRLYTLLGRAYDSKNDSIRAFSAYTTALRYSAFERPYDDPERARETDQNRLRLEVYHSILNGMADKDRTAQETDNEIKQTANLFSDLLQRFLQLQKDKEEARKQIFVEEAKQLSGAADVIGAQSNYQRLTDELNQTENQLEQIRLGVYRKYFERESRQNGELLYRLALLSKEIETKLRLRERVLNRSNYYRGNGNVLGEERTQLRDFIGYRALLELAHRIDSKRIMYVQLLAEEYRTSRELPRAIMYYQLAIDMIQETNQAEPGLALSYMRLAGLYADRQNYIRSVQTYEALFSRTESDLWQGVLEKLRDNPSSNSLVDILPIQTTYRLHLADLYYYKTGPLEKAKSLYNQVLNEMESVPLPTEDQYQLRLSYLKQQYQIKMNLASIERRHRFSIEEATQLESALSIGRQVEQEAESALIALQTIDRQRADLSAQLKAGPDIIEEDANQAEEELSQRFYRLSYVERPVAAEKEAAYRSSLKVIDLPKLLERQAYLAVRNRDFDTARPLYREMIQKGRGDQATRARMNLELLSEGPAAIRRLKLPLDFER